MVHLAYLVENNAALILYLHQSIQAEQHFLPCAEHCRDTWMHRGNDCGTDTNLCPPDKDMQNWHHPGKRKIIMPYLQSMKLTFC